MSESQNFGGASTSTVSVKEHVKIQAVDGAIGMGCFSKNVNSQCDTILVRSASAEPVH